MCQSVSFLFLLPGVSSTTVALVATLPQEASHLRDTKEDVLCHCSSMGHLRCTIQFLGLDR